MRIMWALANQNEGMDCWHDHISSHWRFLKLHCLLHRSQKLVNKCDRNGAYDYEEDDEEDDENGDELLKMYYGCYQLSRMKFI